MKLFKRYWSFERGKRFCGFISEIDKGGLSMYEWYEFFSKRKRIKSPTNS